LTLSPEQQFRYIVDQARTQAQSGDLNQAIALCHQSLELQPHADPHHLLSQIYLAKSQPLESLLHIEQAAKLDPSQHLRASVLFHRGLVSYANGNPVEARGLYDESVKMSPHDAQALEKLAIAVAALGDIPFSIDILQQIWHLEPSYVFHNSLPFVRVTDLYDEQWTQAEAEGGQDGVRSLDAGLSNITKITQQVYMDISINGKEKQRVVFGLFGRAAPKAVRNFLDMTGCEDPKLCYKGARFHRVIADFIIQGGDVSLGTGFGTTNTYGRPFGDDPYALILMHDQPGLLLAANAGPDCNGGQFVVTLSPAPHLNGNHVVMGKVLEGMATIIEANRVPVEDNHVPSVSVTVVDCGLVSARSS
jgi:cyclophilin family peptidyl-prolyl cis-trans isomerase